MSSAISATLASTTSIPVLSVPYTSTVSTTLLNDGDLSYIVNTIFRTEVTVYGVLTAIYTTTNSFGITTTSTAAIATSTGWGPSVPLTNIFTPSPSCFSNWHALYWDYSNAQRDHPTFYLPNADKPDCFPDQFFLLENLAPYYSPGICPKGYTIASTTNVTSTRATGLATINQGACCPRLGEQE